MSQIRVHPVLLALFVALGTSASQLAHADVLGPWSWSLRAGPAWTKTEGVKDAPAALSPRISVWRGVSDRASLGVDLEGLTVRPGAALLGPTEVNWYRAGATWRRTSAPGSIEGFTTLGLGVYLERHREPVGRVFPANVIVPPDKTVDDVAFGPAMGVGLRFGSGLVKGALETRGHWAIGAGSWIQLQAGIDFD